MSLLFLLGRKKKPSDIQTRSHKPFFFLSFFFEFGIVARLNVFWWFLGFASNFSPLPVFYLLNSMTSGAKWLFFFFLPFTVVSYCIPRQYLQCPKPLYVDLTFLFFPFLLKCWNRRRTRGPVVCQMQQERRKSNIDPSDTNHSTPPPYPPFQSMGGRRV
jgi:hypothetical protein